MSIVARVLDCDGTLTDLSKGTLLERLMKDFYERQSASYKLSLGLRSLGVKSYRVFVATFGNIFSDKEWTGETNSLKLFDLLMLRRAGIGMNFLEARAAEYAKLIKPVYVSAIKNCKDDVYIVSSEPVQLLEAVIKHAGLSETIKGVYGTKFEVYNGIIKRMDRSELVAGTSGKHAGMADIVSNGYTKVHAIGDSAADIGLFKTFRKKVVPYTFKSAAPELIEYVSGHGGKVVNSLDEFFKNN